MRQRPFLQEGITMRILMWFAIGFAAACVLGVYLGVGLWLCVACIAIAVMLLLLKTRRATIGAIALIGIAVGMLWTWCYDAFYLNAAKSLDGKTLDCCVTVSDYSYETDYGVAADCDIVLDEKTYKLRAYLPDITPLTPGDKIEGDFRFRLTTADSIQGETYHQGDGIFLLAYADENVKITPADEVPAKYYAAVLRDSISKIILSTFPQDTVAFAKALLLGDSSMLDYATDTDFKVSGIRHVIAVSGLHVSILMSIVYIFSGRRRYLSALIGIPVLFIFAAVAGFTPSVVRACIMQALVLLALFFNQEYDPPTALAFAVLVMLCANPMTVVSVSFQLSTGCLIGIFLFYERINGYIIKKLKLKKGLTKKNRLLRGISSSVSITLSTMITTTPLCAAYFGAVSIVGVLTNLLCLWIISFVFCGIALVCAVGAVWFTGAKWIAWIISWPIRYVITVAKVLASLPFSAVYTCSTYVVLWLAMCYLLLAVFWLSKKKQPFLLACCVSIGLVVAVALSWIEPLGNNYRMTVFDVGQGQSILLESDSRRYLIDCGGESDKAAADTVSQYLLSQGKTCLDGVIVTHYDRDHSGGVLLLMSSIKVDALYLPDVEDKTGMREQLEQAATNVFMISKFSVLEFGRTKLTMIPGVHETNDNERSMCVLFQQENCDILITGDRSAVGEKALLQAVRLPVVEILVAGHHGAASSTSLELLHAVNPDIVVVSAGKGNYYGHPSQDVLFRLNLFSCKIYRTDLNGTMVFRG